MISVCGNQNARSVGVFDEAFKNEVIQYLKVAQVLVNGDSDMESIMVTRSRYYDETDRIQCCIDKIMNLNG